MATPPLSPTERLLLANQYQLLSLLDKENSGAHAAKEEILRHGWQGFYPEVFAGLSEEVDARVTEEVHDILEMFTVLSQALARLSPEQKQGLDLRRLTFQGFDGNHDQHYGQLKFMIERLYLYDELREANLNAHTQTALMQYRRQLPVFTRLRKSAHDFTRLDLQELASV